MQETAPSAAGVFSKLQSAFIVAAIAMALALVGLLAGTSPVAAGLCGTTITTTWSAPGNITVNDTGFLACAGGSTLAGGGQPITEPYAITVSAIDDDTFQLRGSIIGEEFEPGANSPLITLALSDITWLGMPGVISNAVYNTPSHPDAFFIVNGFTNDTISVTGSFGCQGLNCGAIQADLGTIDVEVVPLPAALPLFLSGLAVLGFITRRRRSQSSRRFA